MTGQACDPRSDFCGGIELESPFLAILPVFRGCLSPEAFEAKKSLSGVPVKSGQDRYLRIVK